MNLREPEMPSEAGFGLVETMIAMAIVATMMAMVFASIATNAGMTRAMIERREAVLVARSALDAAIGSSGGPSTALSGNDSEMRWQVVFEPYQPRGRTAPPLDLVTVRVARISSGQTILQLRTLKIGR